MAFGLLAVLGPLRLSALGADATFVAAVFVVAAVAESSVNPLAGHLSDRRGLRAVTIVALPAEAGLLMLLVVPHQSLVLGIVLVVTIGMFGAFWAPAAVLLSAATQRAGISDTYAFALYGVAWAAGQSVGASGGAGLAQLASDLVPCVVLGLALLSTMPLVSRILGSGPVAPSRRSVR
jgi:MFS family permease